MIKDYDHLPFIDDDDKFNDLTIYVRKRAASFTLANGTVSNGNTKRGN
jgi:hypothetical protein